MSTHPAARVPSGVPLLLAILSLSTPVEAQDTSAPADVGTIEMVVDGETWTFEVVEGPVTEGFATGYSAQPRGEAMALGASLYGRHGGSATTINLTVGVWQATMEHMCDPFANQVRVSSDDDAGLSGRLRPGNTQSKTCPPPDDGPGGLALDISLTEANLDDETGLLTVRGTFAGPIGRGDDAPLVEEGRFEATLRPFEELRRER